MTVLPPAFVRFALLTCLTVAGLLTACETSKRSLSESAPPGEPDATDRLKREAVSKQVAVVNEGKVEYLVPRSQLATAFIRQFSDGTVVDNASIRMVQDSKKAKPVYYLVASGLRNGMYRAMALPLRFSSDNSLSLSSSAERYILTSVGCRFCFFSFENNQIVGTSCEENTGGSQCDLTVKNDNTLFVR